jgi:hypothetical protein
MSMGVELSAKQEQEYKQLLARVSSLPAPVNLQGHCAGCGRGIPMGYLAIVVRWRTEEIGMMKRMVPDTLYCRDCDKNVERPTYHQYRKTHKRLGPPRPGEEEETEEQESMSPREMAVKLWAVLSEEPHGSKWLAQAAEIEYSEQVIEVLKILAKAGKVQVVEGKWSKVI